MADIFSYEAWLCRSYNPNNPYKWPSVSAMDKINLPYLGNPVLYNGRFWIDVAYHQDL